MSQILIDTNILIDFLRQKSSIKKQGTLFYRYFYLQENQPALSLITLSELWAGRSMGQKNTRQKIDRLIGSCRVLLPNLETAKLTGKILRQAYEKGRPIAFQDAAIASCAIYHQLPLLTLNTKHFQNIAKLKLISD